MKKFKVVCLILLIVLGLAACSSQDSVTTSEVLKEDIKEIDAFGIIKSTETKDLVIDFSAVVKQVNAKEGQKVKKGDSLLVIDTEDYQAEISKKERELTAAKLELQRLVNSTSGEQKDIKTLQADLASKQKGLKNSSDADIRKALSDLEYCKSMYQKSLKDLSKKEELIKSDAISEEELDITKKDVDAKKKAMEDAQYAIEILKDAKQDEIDKLEANINQRLSSVDNILHSSDINLIKIQKEKITTLEEDISEMKDNMNKSFIKQNSIISDVDNGVVYDIGVKQGNRIDNSRKLLSILDLNSLVVQADVAEDFIKDVKLGADAIIIPQMNKSKEYKGKVTRISNKAILKNGETDVCVEISIDNKDDFLIVDTNVDVKINIIK